jgi:uncharacterized RDD family membrane protein YckC
MSSLPAGWYKDPADTTTQRYWDGEGWLGKAIPADAIPPDGPPPVEEEPPPSEAAASISGEPVTPGWPGQQLPPGTPPGWGTPPAGWGTPPGQIPPGQPPAGWGTPPGQPPAGWGTPPGQVPPGQPPAGWGTPPGQVPPGQVPPGQPPAGWGTPPGQVPPPGSAPPAYGQMPPPGWAPQPGWTPPPGWQPPPGMRMAAFPFPVQARPHGFALAGLGRRLVARLIDIFAVLLLSVVVNGYFAYQWIQEYRPIWHDMVTQMANGGSSFKTPQASTRMNELTLIILAVATLVWLAYEAPAIAGRGQTLGKRIMRIKVVAIESTEPLGFPRAWKRWVRLGIWTPAWTCCGLGFIAQFIDSLSPVFDPLLRQAFHDKVAGTVVIELPPGGAPPVDVTTGASSSSSSSEGRS